MTARSWRAVAGGGARDLETRSGGDLEKGARGVLARCLFPKYIRGFARCAVMPCVNSQPAPSPEDDSAPALDHADYPLWLCRRLGADLRRKSPCHRSVDRGKPGRHFHPMQLTIEIDDETYAGIEAVAKEQHSSVGSVAARFLSRFRTAKPEAKASVKLPHGYKIPVSPSEPFTMDDVRRIEDENDFRGMP